MKSGNVTVEGVGSIDKIYTGPNYLGLAYNKMISSRNKRYIMFFYYYCPYMERWENYYYYQLFFNNAKRDFRRNSENYIDDGYREKTLSDIDYIYLFEYLEKNMSEVIEVVGGNKGEFLKVIKEFIKYIPEDTKEKIQYKIKQMEWNEQNFQYAMKKIDETQKQLDKLSENLKSKRQMPNYWGEYSIIQGWLNQYSYLENEKTEIDSIINKYNKIKTASYISFVTGGLSGLVPAIKELGIISVASLPATLKVAAGVFILSTLVYLGTETYYYFKPEPDMPELNQKLHKLKQTNKEVEKNLKDAIEAAYENAIKPSDEKPEPIPIPKRIGSTKASGNYPSSQFHELFWRFSVELILNNTGSVYQDDFNIHFSGKSYWKEIAININFISMQIEKLKYGNSRLIIHYNYNWDGIDVWDLPHKGKHEAKTGISFPTEKLNKNAKFKFLNTKISYKIP